MNAALLNRGRLTGSQLVFGRHRRTAKAFPLFLLPSGAADAQFLQQARAQLLQLVFSTLINNDSVGATADHLLDRQLPGAEHPFPQQGHPQGPQHQGGQFAGFDIETEPQYPAQHRPRFGDHLAIDHLAVAIRVKAFVEGIGRIHKNHIAHLADAIQGHPTGQARQEAGERVVAQPQGDHLAPIDIHYHLSHHPQATAGVAGDHLGAHQLGAQPEAIAGGGGGGIVGRGDGGSQVRGPVGPL